MFVPVLVIGSANAKALVPSETLSVPALVKAGAVPEAAKSNAPHKRKHDFEQRDYLAGGKAADDAPSVAEMFRIEEGERLSGPAVNPQNATPALFAVTSPPPR